MRFSTRSVIAPMSALVGSVENPLHGLTRLDDAAAPALRRAAERPGDLLHRAAPLAWEDDEEEEDDDEDFLDDEEDVDLGEEEDEDFFEDDEEADDEEELDDE